jgi:hypothetical protein
VGSWRPLVFVDYRIVGRGVACHRVYSRVREEDLSRQALPDLHKGVEKFRAGPDVEVNPQSQLLSHLNLAGNEDG